MKKKQVISKSYVYALADPISKEVMYIGQSVYPHRRYKGHLSYSKGAVGDWIKEILSLGLKPTFIIIGKYPESKITEYETKFIKKYNTPLNSKMPVKPSVSSKHGFIVECIDTGQRFESYSHASRHFDCCASSIKNRCDDGDTTYPSNMRFKRVYL